MEQEKFLCVYWLSRNKSYFIEVTDDFWYSYRSHCDGNGSIFTRMNGPISLVEKIKVENNDIIKNIVNSYFMKYGTEKVIYKN